MSTWILVVYFTTHYGYTNVSAVSANFKSHAQCNQAAEQIKGGAKLYGFSWQCIEVKP